MTEALVLLAILAAGAGVLGLSRATAGVGGIALACLFGIFARIHQASRHHAQAHPKQPNAFAPHRDFVEAEAKQNRP